MLIKRGKKYSSVLLNRSVSWRKEVARQSEANTRLLIALKKYSTPSLCIICDSMVVKKFTIYKVDYLECTNCSHLQSSVMPDIDALNELYVNTEIQESRSAQSNVYINISEDEKKDRIYSLAKPKVDFIAKFVESKFDESLWVDIGSGAGDTLVVASELGFNVRGIESDSSQVEISRKRGIETKEIFLDESNAEKELLNTTVVSLLNVVEHIPNPLNFLSKVVMNLNAGALLAIEVPRHPSLTSIIQTFSEKNTYRHAVPPEHLSLFSDESMKIMINKLGLEIKGKWLFGSDALQIVSTIMDEFAESEISQNTVIHSKLGKLQEAVDAYNLSDTMLIIAQK